MNNLSLCIIGDGGNVHMQNRTRVFAEHGHDVTLITERPSGLSGIDEVVIPIPEGNPVGTVRSLFRYIRELRNTNADVYHLHNARKLGSWAVPIANVHPYVISTLGTDVLFDERKSISDFQRYLTMEVLRKASRITCESQHAREKIQSWGDFDSRLMQVRWGISLKQFQRRDVDGLRERLGFSSDSPVILSPRIPRPFYNIHLIIDAISNVIAQYPQARLVITEYNGDPDYKQELVEQVGKLGINNNVSFVGSLSQSELIDFYSLSDIVVMVPPSDAKPQSLLEAMACETPVVLGDLVHYREFVTHLNDCYFVPISSEGIAAGVNHLLSDENLRTHIAANGRQTVETIADFDQEVDRVEQMLHQLAQKNSPRSRPPIDWRILSKAFGLGFQHLIQKAF